MSDERARALVRLAGQLKTDRSTFESHWQDIADVMRPQQYPFTTIDGQSQQPGTKRTSKMFDSVPPLALEKHAAVLEALLSPRNQVWSKLVANNEDLQEDIEVQRYLDAVNKILFRVRYRPASNLASQLAESYLNLGAFGTQALYISDSMGQGIVYKSCSLHSLIIGENYQGVVDRVFRHYEFDAMQAAEAFGWDKLPASLKTAFENKSTKKWKFMQAVVPRELVEDKGSDYRGFAFASLDVFMHDNTVMQTGGYRVQPYAVSRYTKSADELYGRSPAMLVLADVNMLNRMNKATIKGAEKAVDPPLMTMDDSLAPFNLTAGAMNYGTLDTQGNPTVQAFRHEGRIDLGLEMMEQKRALIREAFLLDLFALIKDAPVYTATQIIEMAKEKAALLSPIMGRQQSELFGPMTSRELDILNAAGLLPDMPDALIEAGGEITVEYQSPLAMAQRAETGASILRTFEAILPLSQTPEGQEAMQVFNITESMLELAKVNGYPAKALRSKEEIAALKEQAQQQQETAQLLEAAPVVSQSLESLAKAQALGANSA
jgi:hypothetical protein